MLGLRRERAERLREVQRLVDEAVGIEVHPRGRKGERDLELLRRQGIVHLHRGGLLSCTVERELDRHAEDRRERVDVLHLLDVYHLDASRRIVPRRHAIARRPGHEHPLAEEPA